MENIASSDQLQQETIYFKCSPDDGLFIQGSTERLLIRSYEEEDFDKCIALYGNKEITKFFDHGEPRTRDQILEYVLDRGRRYFAKGEPYGLYSVFLKADGSFIGQVDVVPTENPGEVEIGWIFFEQFHNKGFCSEAVLQFLLPLIRKVSSAGFYSNGVRISRIVATAHPENAASNRIIQKAGLKFYQSKLRYGGNLRNWYSTELT